MAAAYPSSLVPNAASHGGYSPGQLGSHGGRSPVSSPTPQPPVSSLSSSAGAGAGHGAMGPYSSGALTPGAGNHNTSGNDGGMSSDCSDDEGSPGGPGGNVQIYPWMKKIHVAGAGNTHFPFILRQVHIQMLLRQLPFSNNIHVVLIQTQSDVAN